MESVNGFKIGDKVEHTEIAGIGVIKDWSRHPTTGSWVAQVEGMGVNPFNPLDWGVEGWSVEFLKRPTEA